MTRLTSRSVRFVSCVAIGLLLAYVDGVGVRAMAQTALVFSSLFVAFLVAEAIWKKRKKD